MCVARLNSEKVARKHYLQVTDAHFEKAAKVPTPAKREQAAQNQAQSEPVSVGTDEDAAKAINENRPDLPSDSDDSRCLLKDQVPASGFEPETSGLGNQRSIQLSYAGTRGTVAKARRNFSPAWRAPQPHRILMLSSLL